MARGGDPIGRECSLMRQRPTPSGGSSPREENFDNLDLLFLLSLPKAPAPKVNLTLYDDGFLYFVVFDGE